VPAAAPPLSLALVAARVEARLVEVLDAAIAKWSAFDEDLRAPMEQIAKLVLAGGKRLRPSFCHWGFVGAGGAADDPRDVDAGAALELMHAFALFHDDVMDDAGSRRGTPTAHTAFSALHNAEGWTGESRRFGEGVAILIGDLTFVMADELLAGAPRDAWVVWNELRTELNIGQLLDIIGSVQRDRRLDKAERICRYKSGKYTVERPLHLGAVLAAPDRAGQLLPALSAYGLPLGDAFQMRDDVMGAFGDEAVTGKPVGGDLREGKPTPLLARAVAAASPAQRAVLDRVGAPGLGDEEVAAMQQVIVDTGALAALESQIAELSAEAVAAIERARITAESRDELIALANYVNWRDV